MQKSVICKYFGIPKPNFDKILFFNIHSKKSFHEFPLNPTEAWFTCFFKTYFNVSHSLTLYHLANNTMYDRQLLLHYCSANFGSFFSGNNASLWISNEFCWMRNLGTNSVICKNRVGKNDLHISMQRWLYIQTCGQTRRKKGQTYWLIYRHTDPNPD